MDGGVIRAPPAEGEGQVLQGEDAAQPDGGELSILGLAAAPLATIQRFVVCADIGMAAGAEGHGPPLSRQWGPQVWELLSLSFIQYVMWPRGRVCQGAVGFLGSPSGSPFSHERPIAS